MAYPVSTWLNLFQHCDINKFKEIINPDNIRLNQVDLAGENFWYLFTHWYTDLSHRKIDHLFKQPDFKILNIIESTDRYCFKSHPFAFQYEISKKCIRKSLYITYKIFKNHFVKNILLKCHLVGPIYWNRDSHFSEKINFSQYLINTERHISIITFVRNEMRKNSILSELIFEKIKKK